VADERWKKAVFTDLAQLKQVVAKNSDADAFGRFEDDEEKVLQATNAATNEAECLAVNRKVDALEKKYLR
jgi:hypothetical protein